MVYQANGHALAQLALAQAFPVLEQLLDAENFAALAHSFWHVSPPARGDIGQWGDALPDFLESSPQWVEEPFLADVARTEWAMHSAATLADDLPFDASSFALLTQHDADHVTLRLSSATRLIASAWPVASIMTAHLDGCPSLQDAGRLLSARHGEVALVWRDVFRVRVRLAKPSEALLLGELLGGKSLEVALEAALGGEHAARQDSDEVFDFSNWLAQAAQSGLVLAASHVPCAADQSEPSVTCESDSAKGH